MSASILCQCGDRINFLFFQENMQLWRIKIVKEYQNILKDYLQNLVICSYIGVEITRNFV